MSRDTELRAVAALDDALELIELHGLHAEPEYRRLKSLHAALITRTEADEAATVCDKLRPGAPCPTPGSCRENGCSAVERELFDEAATVGAVAYIVPSARVSSDGSWEDGPNSLVFAEEADDYVRRVGAPLFTHPQDASAGWMPIETAPRDGAMLRLLVEFTEHATEDSEGPSPTIGANNFENDGEDRWQFAGWCWTHDHFTQGEGRPVAWLPMLAALPSPPKGDAE